MSSSVQSKFSFPMEANCFLMILQSIKTGSFVQLVSYVGHMYINYFHGILFPSSTSDTRSPISKVIFFCFFAEPYLRDFRLNARPQVTNTGMRQFNRGRWSWLQLPALPLRKEKGKHQRGILGVLQAESTGGPVTVVDTH